MVLSFRQRRWSFGVCDQNNARADDLGESCETHTATQRVHQGSWWFPPGQLVAIPTWRWFCPAEVCLTVSCCEGYEEKSSPSIPMNDIMS